jgi:hypothetical protein
MMGALDGAGRNGRLLAVWRDLPGPIRWGAAIAIVGLAVDLVTHVAAGGRMPTGFAAAAGHGLTLGGMLLALAGLLWLGFRSTRLARSHGRRS